MNDSFWVESREALFIVCKYVCFEQEDLVLDVLIWKETWVIKEELLSRSWKCENEKQDRGQEWQQG